jgi:E1-E2 ATPase
VDWGQGRCRPHDGIYHPESITYSDTGAFYRRRDSNGEHLLPNASWSGRFKLAEMVAGPVCPAVSILRLSKHDSTLFGKSGGKSSTALALGFQPSSQTFHRRLRPANGSDYCFANHTGEVIPVDGKVDEGDALVDQHALTGESAPAEKSRDNVFATTVILAAKILIRVERAGKDTESSKITAVLRRYRSGVDELTI